MSLLSRCFKFSHRHAINQLSRPGTPATVCDLAPRCQAHVTGFSPLLTAERRALLRAYGLVPGYPIYIVQQSPVSVIQVEHAEIALEAELARAIFVCED